MNRNRTVQPHEIPAIDCNETAVVIRGISQHRVVLDPLIRPAHVVRRKHIVPKSTKFTHALDRKVLVCLKPRHSPTKSPIRIVLGNFMVDLPWMTGHILPGIQQIRSLQ